MCARDVESCRVGRRARDVREGAQRTVMAVALALGLVCGTARVDARTGDDSGVGLAALVCGDLAGARRIFAAAVSADPSRPLALAGLAATSLLAGRPQQAVNSFSTAAQLDAQSAWPHACLGAALLASGQIDEAGQAFEAALARRHHWPAVRARLAYVQWRRGLTAAALENARLARNLGEQYFAPLVEAAILLSQGDPAAAYDAAAAARLPAGKPLRALVPEPISPASLLIAAAQPKTSPVVTPAAPAAAIEFLWPKPGAKVSGRVEIRVRAEVPLKYVVYYVDDQFIAVSYVEPFRAPWDTWRWRDGVHRLRAEGYDAQGRRAASREVELVLANRRRTIDAAQRAADVPLGRALAELCLPLPQPTDFFILRGRAAAGVGRWRECLDALEEGFARCPWSRPMRTALESAYCDLGVARPAAGEIHLLPTTREIALTFDDGPHPRITPYLLDVLAQRHVRATFFLVGKQCLVYPDLVRKIVAAGHEVGSHSFTHANMCRISELDVMRELAESRWAIRQACGRSVVLFRPPGGHYSPTVRAVCARMGFRPVFWNANICRYAGDPPEQIVANLVSNLSHGGIVLLHNGEDETPQIIEPLLDALLAAGFKLGPVGEFAGVPEPYFALERPEKVGLAR